MKKTTLLLAALLAYAPVEGARDFTKNTANYMNLGDDVLGTTLGACSGISVSFVVYLDTLGSQDDFFNFWNSATTTASIIALLGNTTYGYAGRVTADAYGKSRNAANATPTGQWVVIGMSVDWSANPYVITHYRNGSSISSGNTAAGAGGTFVHTSGTSVDSIGYYSSTGGAPNLTARQIDGRIAELTIWNKVLTYGDFLALGSGALPTRVQPANITAYWKLNGQGSPEIEIFNRLSATITGSVPVADHPPVR